MSSRLAGMLADELAAQRTFLSAEEAAALCLPAGHDDEDDLAWQRLRGRRSWFFPVLRDRFIRDGRREEVWRTLIEDEEAVAGGEPTFITHMARQVLEWSARTSDRSAMMAGFAATALRILGVVLLVLGAWAYVNGARAGGAIVGGGGLVFVLASAGFGAYAARRVNSLRRAATARRPVGI